MKRRKLIKKCATFLIILFYLSSFVTAQDDWETGGSGGEYEDEWESDFEEEGSSDPALEFDPNDPNAFDWQNGDYNSVDWSQVTDWSNVKLHKLTNKNYNDPKLYQNMPRSSYRWIDYNKVNYGLGSLDHRKIDPNKYAQDKGLAGDLSVATTAKGSVKYSNNGIQNGGDFVSVPGNYEFGTTFVVTGDEIIVRPPSGQTEADMPSPEDSVIVDTEGEDITLIPPTEEGEEPENEITVKGEMDFEEGEMTLNGGSSMEVKDDEGNVIADVEANEDTNIYGLTDDDKSKEYKDMEESGADGEYFYNDLANSGENGIYFGDDVLAMYGESDDLYNGAFNVGLTKDNPYIDMDEDDVLAFTATDGGFVIEDQIIGDSSVTSVGTGKMQNGMSEVNFVEDEDGDVSVFAKTDLRDAPDDYEPGDSSVAMDIDVKNQDSVHYHSGESEGMLAMGDNNAMDFGNLAYASVTIDPTKDDKYNIDVNLGAEAENYHLIVTTPGADDYESGMFNDIADSYASNLGPGHYPIVIDGTDTIYTNDILDSLKKEGVDLGKVADTTVIGHSNWGYENESDPTPGLYVQGAGGLTPEIDRDVSLGCSVSQSQYAATQAKVIKYLSTPEDQRPDNPWLEKALAESQFDWDHEAGEGKDFWVGDDGAIRFSDGVGGSNHKALDEFMANHVLTQPEITFDDLYGTKLGENGLMESGLPIGNMAVLAAMKSQSTKPGYQGMSNEKLLASLSNQKGSSYQFPNCVYAEYAGQMAANIWPDMGYTYSPKCT